MLTSDLPPQDVMPTRLRGCTGGCFSDASVHLFRRPLNVPGVRFVISVVWAKEAEMLVFLREKQTF